MKEATTRILNETRRIPVKKYNDGELVVACAYRQQDGTFVVNVNENLWGYAGEPIVQVTYEDEASLTKAGWGID